mmetsp:Transcript_80726/g.160371  ORF Transcript_80726/g.160371 Transcript_80726/m.160371 type:complete len:309 (+) Transcript_80726:205-1131(+)
MPLADHGNSRGERIPASASTEPNPSSCSSADKRTASAVWSPLAFTPTPSGSSGAGSERGAAVVTGWLELEEDGGERAVGEALLDTESPVDLVCSLRKEGSRCPPDSDQAGMASFLRNDASRMPPERDQAGELAKWGIGTGANWSSLVFISVGALVVALPPPAPLTPSALAAVAGLAVPSAPSTGAPDAPSTGASVSAGSGKGLTPPDKFIACWEGEGDVKRPVSEADVSTAVRLVSSTGSSRSESPLHVGRVIESSGRRSSSFEGEARLATDSRPVVEARPSAGPLYGGRRSVWPAKRLSSSSLDEDS